MTSIDMSVPTGQLVVTSQVPTQAATNISVNVTNPLINAATNISVNVTNPLINGTNQSASGHPTYHELVWFWLEGQASLPFVAGPNRV